MLEGLLNTKLKKRVLAIFFAFPKRSFTTSELRQTAGASERLVNAVVKELLRAEVLALTYRKRSRLLRVNSRFPLYQELDDLVGKEFGGELDAVSKLLKKLPNAKLIILTGMFSFQPHLPTDILIVGRQIGKIRLQNLLAEIEKLTDQEVCYTLMDDNEYEYRRMMNDRFVRDILDNSHVVVLNTFRSKKIKI